MDTGKLKIILSAPAGGKGGKSSTMPRLKGFHDRWHPDRRYERFCAEGRDAFPPEHGGDMTIHGDVV